jgi:hypothetical protein
MGSHGYPAAVTGSAAAKADTAKPDLAAPQMIETD